MRKHTKKLLVDAAIVVASVMLAIYIVHSGAVELLLSLLGENVLIASFVAGLCFTSVFTTAPAIVVLVQLAKQENIFLVAAFGALGAMLFDLILFSFVRYRVVKDASELMRGPRWRGVRHVLRNRHMRRFLPIAGAIIIASPFPDEIGLALMGASKLTTPKFLAISYIMNLLGILSIGFITSIV